MGELKFKFKLLDLTPLALYYCKSLKPLVLLGNRSEIGMANPLPAARSLLPDA